VLTYYKGCGRLSDKTADHSINGTLASRSGGIVHSEQLIERAEADARRGMMTGSEKSTKLRENMHLHGESD